VTDRSPIPRARPGELREIRRGGFTISRLHRSGIAPFRALLIGSRAVIGPGTAVSDTRWFAEHLADRTWLQLRRGVDLDVLWELRPVLDAIRSSADSWRLWRYDAVVIMLAVAPAGFSAKRRLARVPRLVERVLERIAALSSVLVVALDPSDLHHSVRVESLGPPDATLADVTTGDGAAVRSIVVPGDARISADRIAQELVATAVRTQRTSGDPRPLDADPDTEPARLAALAELGLVTGAASPELVRLLKGAQAAFGADLASVNIIDHDRVRPLAVVGGIRASELPRRDALCTLTLGARGAVIIEDTWRDPDLASHPIVHGDPAVRFFAAYPLESVEGHRIGAFCIYDAEPREMDEVDIELLRDLALLAEAEITSHRA
jgi:hypothetical protein